MSETTRHLYADRWNVGEEHPAGTDKRGGCPPRLRSPECDVFCTECFLACREQSALACIGRWCRCNLPLAHRLRRRSRPAHSWRGLRNRLISESRLRAEDADSDMTCGLIMRGAAVDHTWSYDQKDRHGFGRPVVVLGMHRSGTSVVARIINVLGLPLCRADDLLSGPDNPTGYWESASLVKFNDRLLKMFGGSWVFPPPMSRNWESAPSVAAIRGEGGHVFTHAYPNEQWVWKDPRTCLTLPFWRTVWREAPVVVFVSREPLEIFLSLGKRDGLGKAHCIALWERYAR